MNTPPQIIPTLPIQGEFPPASMPVLYADGVTSVAPAQMVVKFFLGRLEPHLRAENKTLTQPFTQVVMPTGGFLQTALFFENAVKNMLAQGIITTQQIDEVRASAGVVK